MGLTRITFFISFLNIILLTEIKGHAARHNHNHNQPPENDHDVECLSDVDCLHTHSCNSENMCIDVCEHPCSGVHEECFPNYHTKQCQCISGYTRHATGICKEVGCTSNEDCENHEACSSNGCVDPCTGYECDSSNEICVANDHVASCVCLHGYQRLGGRVCEKECSSTNDCEQNEVCEQFKNDIFICRCKNNFSHDYNNNGHCKKNCLDAKDCPINHWCNDYLCIKCNRTSCPIHF